MRQRLINRLKACSYSPPTGDWNWEVQRRCYCFVPFFEGFLGKPAPETVNEILGTCPDEYLLDHLANILSGKAAITTVTFETETALEASCQYIVSGDCESIYVPIPVIKRSYEHIAKLQRDRVIKLVCD